MGDSAEVDSTDRLLQEYTAQISLFGVDLIQNDEPWQFVMAFPLPVDGDLLADNVEDPIATWKAIFPRTGMQEQPFEPPITKKDFIDLARAQIEKILRGPHFKCKLDSFQSIDKDESFLTIWLEDADMLDSLAERVEARARVKVSAYKDAGLDCPTELKGAEDFTTLPHDLDPTGHAYNYLHTGYPMDNSCPAYVLFRKELKEKLEKFEEPQVLRIVRRHMINYMNIEVLQKAGVITNFFAVHKWRHLNELHRRGWNDLKSLFSWPKDGTADHIVQYSGVQAAFFFHLFNTFTRWILGPAVLSTINFVLRRGPWVDARQMQWVDSAYGAMLCIWTTIFLVRYEQLENLKIFRWGMHGAEDEIAPVRKEFSDRYRGSCLETLQNLTHWILCVLFMAETVAAAGYITKIRSAAYNDPESSTFGIPNDTVVLCAKYAITLNIKLVDSIWTPLSTWLSKKENWRTETDLKAEMVVKLFAVKFVVFYYPFAYTIFIQPHTAQGCDGGHMSGCVSKLRSDLYFFFVTQVCTEALGLCMTLFFVYWSVREEKKKVEGQEGRKRITYLELQAKLPTYGEADQIEDYMNLVLIFGFISMFGVTCPSMSILCFIFNFPIKRLLAYKVSYARQRSVPRVEEGIGAWRAILNFIAYMGVTTTCYIVIFVFNIEKMDLSTKLIVFMAAERVLMALKKALEGLMGSKTVAQLRIQEHNEQVLDKVLNGDGYA